MAQLSRSDLADFSYFAEVAKYRSFRRAAVELGVSTSALSHAMSGLEGRMGVRLLNRTTRSVTLTAAGEDLLASIREPLERISQAAEDLNRYRDALAGRIRLNVLEDAASLLLEPVIPVFVGRYPDIDLQISVSNRFIDVIDSGFDAGIRHGGTVPQDMVAQRLSADIRWMAAASPAYIARFGRPCHPEELRQHRCIGIRLGNDEVYQWEFEHAGEELTVETPGPVTVDESHIALGLGLRGVGVIYGAEPILRPHLDGGALEPVLRGWETSGSGYHVYYSSRRHVPTGLRLLIDLIRELRPCGL